MSQFEIVILRRDVPALLVPSGANINLQRGTEVTITQALGSSYTVNVYGNLARIDAKDADALGKEVIDPFTDIDMDQASTEDLVWASLKTVYDPEIPVNIVDLGLIYTCEVIPLGKGDSAVRIKMTLTAPGCGMGPVIIEDVKHKVSQIPGVTQVEVELVFDPPWDRNNMSDEAKLQLGMFY